MTTPESLGAQFDRTRAALERNRRPEEPSPSAEAERLAAERRAAEVRRIREARFAESCPARFAAARMEDLPEPRASEIEAWCSAPEGRNLVLSGPVGCGKTHAAIAAARQVLGACLTWQICSAVELLDRLRPDGPEGELERACSVSLLVLDDVGAERATDWTAERMAAVIDRRWLDERPIVATTNLSLGPEGELVAAIGERSYSRLVGSGAVVLQLTGDDRRRA